MIGRTSEKCHNLNKYLSLTSLFLLHWKVSSWNIDHSLARMNQPSLLSSIAPFPKPNLTRTLIWDRPIFGWIIVRSSGVISFSVLRGCPSRWYDLDIKEIKQNSRGRRLQRQQNNKANHTRQRTWICEIKLTFVPSCSQMRLQLLHFHAVFKTWSTFRFVSFRVQGCS